jgi:hypothetical protein
MSKEQNNAAAKKEQKKYDRAGRRASVIYQIEKTRN